MFKRIFLAFLVVPLVELVLIFVMAHFLGWGFTLLFTIASSIVGVYLAKRSWHSWWQLVKTEWAEEGFPVHRLGEGAILVTSMSFMITPGPMTGILGILFTIPKIRERISKVLMRYVSNRLAERFFQ